MNPKTTVLKQAQALAMQISTEQKLKLAEWLIHSMQDDLTSMHVTRKSPYGLLADAGTAPSEQDIAEAREDTWSGFPHEASK